MKYLLTFTCIFILYHGSAQTIRFDTLRKKASVSIILVSDNKEFSVSDSIKGIVAIKKKDTLIIIDSLATIQTLIKISESHFKHQEEQNKRLLAAQDILNYITIDGFVFNKNRVAFNRAVVRYRKLLGLK